MNTPDAARARASRFAFLSAIPLVGWIVIALSTLGVAGGVAIAVNASGAEPAVGLYWQTNTDPTAGGGVAAPLWQLLWRTDAPSIYFKSGAANTAWTKVGSGTASGGTVTSISAGTGITATPNPITTTGTIAITNTAVTPGSYTLTDLTVNQQGQITSATSYAGSSTGACGAGSVVTAEALSSAGALTHTCTAIGTAGGVTGTGTSPDLTVWSSSTAIGNYAGSSPAACTAGNVVTGTALSAAGALTNTCTAIGTAGGVTGSGTAGRSVRFSGTTAIGNGAFLDDGTNATAQGSLTSILGVNQFGNEQGNVLSPTALGASQNDYSGCDTNGRICQVSASTTNIAITGFTGGAAGRYLTIENVGTTNDVALNNETASTAANQIRLPSALNWIIKPKCATTLAYDATNSRWRMIAWGCGNVPGFTVDGNFTFGSGVSSSHIMNGFLDGEKNMTAASLNQSGIIRFRDTAALALGNGGMFTMAGIYTGIGTVINGAAIRAWKVNATDGDSSYDLVFGTNTNGVAGGPQEWLRLTAFGHLDTKGTAPAVSACGTSPPVIVGNDKAGTVTIGTGGTATSCTITFASPYVNNAPPCTLTSQMSARTDLYLSALSASAFTVSNGAGAAFPASGKFNYQCLGTP